jgi:hypothetical protein
MENQNKMHKPRTLSYSYQHFRDLFFKIEMFDLHAVSIFATGTGESDTPPPLFFASCGTQFIEK